MEENKEEINIFSEEVRDVLAEPPKAIFKWGNTILFFFIMLILFLSFLIKYPDTVQAQLTLTTEVPPQKEFARVTGKIDTLFTSNYQEITPNAPLALIENTANYKDVVFLKSILDTIQLEKDDFVFPLDSLPMLFLGELETNFSQFENNYVQYRLSIESESFLSNDLTNTYAISQLQSRLKTLSNQKELYQEEVRFKKKSLERLEALYKKGVISTQELENEKLEFFEVERNFKNLNFSISQLREGVNSSKNLKKQTAIEYQNSKVTLFKSVVQSFDQLKEAIKSWEMKYLFKSNIEGTVSFMKIWNANQTINEGDFVFTIIPKDYNLYLAKVKAPISNSGKIKVGQSVNIKLLGYPDTEFGVLKGVVKEISLIPNEEGFYLIDVSLPKKLITTYKKEIEFRQEMEGVAEIITEDLRLIERIFYQFKQILNR